MKQFFFVAALTVLCSNLCAQQRADKAKFLKQFETLVQVVQGREAISPTQWSDFDRDYEYLSVEVYQSLERSFTPDELARLQELRQSYHNRRIRSCAANGVKGAVNIVRQFFYEVAN